MIIFHCITSKKVCQELFFQRLYLRLAIINGVHRYPFLYTRSHTNIELLYEDHLAKLIQIIIPPPYNA